MTSTSGRGTGPRAVSGPGSSGSGTTRPACRPRGIGVRTSCRSPEDRHATAEEAAAICVLETGRFFGGNSKSICRHPRACGGFCCRRAGLASYAVTPGNRRSSRSSASAGSNCFNVSSCPFFCPSFALPMSQPFPARISSFCSPAFSAFPAASVRSRWL